VSATRVARSANGQVVYCPGCKVFHLEFGNLHLSLWIEQLFELWESLETVNAPHLEWMNRHVPFRRKVMVPMPRGSANMVFTALEIDELRDLLARAVDRAVAPDAVRARTEA
jgi:hypothetical protein